jgi:catechol 2,3-dioxygenase-like lactoylglutathione lyase family enzyme
VSPPALVRLEVAAEADAWAAAGFAVDGNTVKVGPVAIDLVGVAAGKRIVRWHLTELSCDELDGLPTAAAEAAPEPTGETHRNGVVSLDHVVAFSPDLDRTVAALTNAGLDLRRVREGPTPAGAQRQAFFRVGQPILEMIESPPGTPEADDKEAPARFYGLAFGVADLDATASTLGERLGHVRDAVQPGRRIATVRREADLGLPVALMSERPRSGS